MGVFVLGIGGFSEVEGNFLQKNQNENLQLELLNLQGQVLQQFDFKGKSLEVDLADYPIGVYLVRVFDGYHTVSKKILHQN